MIAKAGQDLVVEDLRTYFQTEEGVARAVDGVSFSVPRGKTVALVGESGCGKSVTALSILRLVEKPAGRIVGGRVRLGDLDLLGLSERQMRAVRGDRIAMIFQEPMTALNPVFTIGNQLVEAIRLHQDLSSRQSRELAAELLGKVGIPEPAERLRSYPHQLSGGMRQRAMIAMALACQPDLLIADEPTTALDVTIQAQILRLLNSLQKQMHMSVLFITHDLGVVAQSADYVVVMYAGKVVERADVHDLFEHPLHPYTRGLLDALPRLGRRKGDLKTIPGQVPNPVDPPKGCRFHPRCELCQATGSRCQYEEPPLVEVRPGHDVACWEAAKRIEEA
ncbi:MAG: ABC transporter ATP-binding protein [Phycisphaerae bacterium]|nr:ABC transporter ATP-binding protein [Phycisphaerae bacterium]